MFQIDNKIIEELGKQEAITSKNLKRKTAINKKQILKLSIIKFRILENLHINSKVQLRKKLKIIVSLLNQYSQAPS